MQQHRSREQTMLEDNQIQFNITPSIRVLIAVSLEKRMQNRPSQKQSQQSIVLLLLKVTVYLYETIDFIVFEGLTKFLSLLHTFRKRKGQKTIEKRNAIFVSHHRTQRPPEETVIYNKITAIIMLIFRKKSLIQRKLATKENNFFQSTKKLFLVSLVIKQGPSRHEELIKANDSFR